MRDNWVRNLLMLFVGFIALTSIGGGLAILTGAGSVSSGVARWQSIPNVYHSCTASDRFCRGQFAGCSCDDADRPSEGVSPDHCSRCDYGGVYHR